MNKVRRCDDRCHEAAGSRCRCLCGGFFHGQGEDALVNRERVEDAVQFLQEHGKKPGKTAYITQRRLPL